MCGEWRSLGMAYVAHHPKNTATDAAIILRSINIDLLLTQQETLPLAFGAIRLVSCFNHVTQAIQHVVCII